MKIIYTWLVLLFCASAAWGAALEDNNSGIAAMNEGRFEDAIHFFTIAGAEDPGTLQ